jgi:hypothetical protein
MLGGRTNRGVKIRYDKDVDVLYGSVAHTVEATYEPVAPGAYLRRNAQTGELTGFMILEFASRQMIGTLPRIPELEAVGLPPLNQIRYLE